MSDVEIHPTAIVDPTAQLGSGTIVGPYCIIGPSVEVGQSCWLQHQVTLMGPLRIGDRNKFYAYCSIGQQTQDLKYAGEPTYLEIGHENTFREFVTVNRSSKSDGKTQIANRGNFLAYSHIGHDCVVGDAVVFSNNGTLAGHVRIDDHAIMGGLTAVHQFCRIGSYAFIGGHTVVTQDVLPFSRTSAVREAHAFGVNSVGLERKGFSKESVRHLQRAYRLLLNSGLNTSQALEKMREANAEEADENVGKLIEFITSSQRGVIK